MFSIRSLNLSISRVHNLYARKFNFTPFVEYKKTLEQLDSEHPGMLKGKNVLVRVDFNVPLSKSDGSTITDDTRIREALPTINFLSDAGARVVLASHCGRPKGMVNDKMRMTPMATRLAELTGKPVGTAGDCIGPEVEAAIAGLGDGEMLMLENARFHKEEEKNDTDFAKKLASGIDVFVNDAFGTAHRAHGTTEGVAHHVPHKVAGYLLEKELKFLKGAVDEPNRPFAAIVGGAKVSTKIPVIESLIEKCDKIFVGGGMIFTFYKAQGLDVGASMVEEDFIPMAKELMDKAAAKGVKFFLPSDVIVADKFAADAEAKVVPISEIPDGWMGLDIGTESVKTFQNEVKSCSTVVWNGPMGVFEFEKFANGTFSVARALADVTAAGGTTIIGGGDSVAAVMVSGLQDQMSHISTGGGASLEMLEGKELPGVAALDDA